MPKTSDPGLNLFLDTLLKLEELDTPYVTSSLAVLPLRFMGSREPYLISTLLLIMMVFNYLGGDTDLDFDSEYVSERTSKIGEKAVDLWEQINAAAKEEASRS